MLAIITTHFIIAKVTLRWLVIAACAVTSTAAAITAATAWLVVLIIIRQLERDWLCLLAFIVFKAVLHNWNLCM
jgi:hypothetical protein